MAPPSTPKIPERTESLNWQTRIFGEEESERNADPETINERTEKIEQYYEDLKTAKKRLRAGPSYDGYASDLHQTFFKKAKISDLKIKNSFEAFGHDYKGWLQTDQAAELLRQQHATKAELTKWEWHTRQIQNVKSAVGDVMEDFRILFKTSSIGWKLDLKKANRKSNVQSKFRDAVLESYGASDVDRFRVWCPIIRKWENAKSVNAGHIFPHSASQSVMTTIFGTKDELMDARNGMPISNQIEKFFDDYRIALVPDWPGSPPSQIDIANWQQNKVVRKYKIKVLDTTCQRMSTEKIEGGKNDGCSILELDGRPVEFLNDFRPRARYLFFHYLGCISTQIHAHPDRKQVLIDNETQKPVWGTMGKYIRKSPLVGFVAELGLDLEFVEHNAIDDENEPSETTMEMDTNLTDVLHAKEAAKVEDDGDDEDEDEETMSEEE